MEGRGRDRYSPRPGIHCPGISRSCVLLPAIRRSPSSCPCFWPFNVQGLGEGGTNGRETDSRSLELIFADLSISLSLSDSNLTLTLQFRGRYAFYLAGEIMMIQPRQRFSRSITGLPPGNLLADPWTWSSRSKRVGRLAFIVKMAHLSGQPRFESFPRKQFTLFH